MARAMLSGREIAALVGSGELALNPFDRGMVRPSSYALRLAPRLLAVCGTEPASVDGFDGSSEVRTVAADRAGTFRIEPGVLYLAASEEAVGLPADVAGMLSVVSRLARLGLGVNTGATLVQAGYGHDGLCALTFEVVNFASRAVSLRPGMPFCHLTLHRHNMPPDVPYAARPEDRGAGPVPARY
jgi:dCTP deaminase